MSLPRRIAYGLTAALLSGGAALTLASPASASPQHASKTTASALLACSGSACDDQDPVAAGCDAGAVTVDSASTGFGTEDLRFSSTCQTNWVRLRNYPGGGTLTFWAEDVASNGSATVDLFDVPTPIGAGTHFGNMIFSPGSDCAIGKVFRDGVQIGRTLESSAC